MGKDFWKETATTTGQTELGLAAAAGGLSLKGPGPIKRDFS